jgi:hypothetical protein
MLMIPEDLALQSMTVDATVCLVTGPAALVLSPRLGRAAELPTAAVAGAGAATTLWGGWVAMAAGSGEWRQAARVSAATNLAVTTGLGVLAATRSGARARGLIAGVGAVSGAIAAVQVAALLWDRKSRIGTGQGENASM